MENANNDGDEIDAKIEIVENFPVIKDYYLVLRGKNRD